MEMKTETIFYSVPHIDHSKIKTLNQLLEHVFPFHQEKIENEILVTHTSASSLEPKSLDNNTNKIKIDRQFIKELAYGIQSHKYFDPKRTPHMVVDKIRTIRKVALANNNHSVSDACNFFLIHFIEATNTFASTYEMKETFFNNPIMLEEEFKAICHAKKIGAKKLVLDYAQALANDIFIMNSKAFLSLSIPIDPHHRLVEYSNKLVQLISDDLALWLKFPALSVFKVRVYLETAKKLLLVNDYHGAAAIEMAFQWHKDAIQHQDKYPTTLKQELMALHELYAYQKNYLILRNKMRAEPGIRFFSILCKDLDKANENKQIGDKISIYGKLYCELAEEKRAVSQQITMQPCEYQTNLGILMSSGLPITTKIPEELLIEEVPLLEKLRLSTRRVTSEEKVERKNSKERKKQQRCSMDESALEKKDSLMLDEQQRACNRRSTIANLGRFFSLSVSSDEEEEEEEKQTKKWVEKANRMSI